MSPFVILAVLIIIGLVSFKIFSKPDGNISEEKTEAKVLPAEVQKIDLQKNSQKKPQKQVPKQTPKQLIDSFKNIQSPVVDFDTKPGYLALCCEDSTLRIYKTTSYTDTKAKYVQGTLLKNQPSAVSLAIPGNIIYVAGTQDLQIHMFKVVSIKSKLVLEEEKVFIKKHFMKISSLAYTPTCLISCAEEQDTTIHIWSHNGDILFSHENKQLRHKKLVISNNHKFFSITTWLGSARIFEVVKEKKTESFQTISVVMELGGHSQGLTTIGFSFDSSLAVTCSQDYSVRLWNINVQYNIKESPILLKTMKLDSNKTTPAACALNDKRLILACDTEIMVFNVPNLEFLYNIENAHTFPIKKLELFEEVLISCSSDPRIYLWHID